MSEVNGKILEKVKECLSQALGLEAEEIHLNSSLTRDLGAESIDFLDIVFRMEQAFSIKIPRGDLFPEQFLSNADYVQKGMVSRLGLQELKRRFPFTDFGQFESDPLVSKLIDTFTVKSLVGYLTERLSAANLRT